MYRHIMYTHLRERVRLRSPSQIEIQSESESIRLISLTMIWVAPFPES
jgi:hypothetical protein